MDTHNSNSGDYCNADPNEKVDPVVSPETSINTYLTSSILQNNDLNDSSSESPTEEALRNQLIIESLLHILPLDSLKIVRQVSAFFNHQTSKEMFSRYYLSVPSYLHRVQDTSQLENFISKYDGIIKFNNVKISAMGSFSNRGIFEGYIDSLFGYHLKRLIFCTYVSQTEIQQLCSRFEGGHMPCLKFLSLHNIPISPSDTQWPILMSVFGQLDQLHVDRLSREALLVLFNLKNDAPTAVKKFLPGLAHWTTASDGFIPRGSLVGGRYEEQNLIVSRAHFGGDLLPGKLVASDGACYVPWDGRAHAVRKYETFVIQEDEVEWVRASSDQKVEGAVVGGMTNYGELLYVGRVMKEEGGSHSELGKIHRSHRVLYTSKDGMEIADSTYESLVLKQY